MKATKVLLCGGMLVASLVAASPLEDPPVFQLQWGSFGTLPGQFKNLYGLATDPIGNVYVADNGNDRIQVFTGSGALVRTWTAPSLDSPLGIACGPSGHVYVTANNRVQVFTPTGVLLHLWGGLGELPGLFDSPYGIAVDDSEYVYVADSQNGRIQKFTSDGILVNYWGTETGGSAPGEFRRPIGIAVNSQRRVYVADQLNGRIQVFDSNGTFIREWSTPPRLPFYVAIDRDDNVYVTDNSVSSDKCLKFRPDGTFVVEWGSHGSGQGQFESPTGIAVDHLGNIFVADGFFLGSRARIQKFAPGVTRSSSATWGSVKVRYR